MSLQEIEKTFDANEIEGHTWTLLQVNFVEGKPVIAPIKIDPLNKEDKVSEFVVQTLGHAREMLKDLKMPIGEYKSHGRRRGHREIGDIRAQREKQLKEVTTAIGILDGSLPQPIEFIESEGAILGFNVHEGILDTEGNKP